MSVYDEQASRELMEKLASMEPEVPAQPAPQMAKQASEVPRGSRAVRLLKLGELLKEARRIGQLRAEAEIAALNKR